VIQSSRASGPGMANESRWVAEVATTLPARLDTAQILAAVRALPEVESATASTPGFHAGVGVSRTVLAQCGNCYVGGLPVPIQSRRVVHHAVSGAAMVGLSAPSESAELFEPHGIEPPRVAIVNRVFARDSFEDGQAVGRAIRIGDTENDWYTVVAVVEGGPPRSALGGEEQPTAEVYLPIGRLSLTAMELSIEGGVDRRRLVDAIERASPGSGVTSIRTRTAYVDHQTAPSRWFGQAFGVLAALMIVLTGYAVYVVSRLGARARRVEMGIRRSFGAKRARVFLHLIGEGVGLAVLGSLAGLWLYLFVHEPLEDATSVSLGLGALAGTVALVVGVHLLTAFAGCFGPARVASNLAPVEALKAG
jgi:hypothetical protein